MFQLLLVVCCGIFQFACYGQEGRAEAQIDHQRAEKQESRTPPVLTAADQPDRYLPLLQGKKVALLVNQTSRAKGQLLPDYLISEGIEVVRIFSPEHGFRGEADAGAEVKSGRDSRTGLEVVSLYGKNKKPTATQLKGIDIMVYDVQDVGVRFYTYISTLEYLMEACGEQQIPLLILDRPNPLGFMVDGPVLEKAQQSFVGMQPIPVVYGMTPGEYAHMLIGEKWLKGPPPELRVITCENYDHKSLYAVPVPPSPNLKNMAAIYLYPALCFFEGTVLSVGRGTSQPFQQYGHPALRNQPHNFIPVSVKGATDPPFQGKTCHGVFIAATPEEAMGKMAGRLNLQWLLQAYADFPDKNAFFNNFFNNLAGNTALKAQIRAGKSEAEIRESWEPALSRFKEIRKAYLLYPDVEG